MFTLNCKGTLLVVDKPLVMGIINVTPDSFYSGSRVEDETEILKRVEEMIKDGVDVVDVGGQSTRPGSMELSAEEEAERVVHIIESLRAHFPDLILSVDTFYSAVALAAVNVGARMVNDISGGQRDANMLSVVGKLDVPYICMHIKGTPA